MAETVIAITGENANGILDCQSQRYLDLMSTMGLTGLLLRATDPDFVTKLNHALERGVLFAWGYAGVGARLAIGPRSLWDVTQVPFISVLADAPYIMPNNHQIGSSYVVNGYVYREWLDLQQRHFASNQISALLPLGVLRNPQRDLVPWARRSCRMLLVKTAADPDAQRATWSQWPTQLRAVLNECADLLARRRPGPIAPLVHECLAAHALVLDHRRPVLFGLMHELDTYIRALRATVMARALLPLPVDIVGGGWNHLSGNPCRARFHPPVAAASLEAVYADTQVLLNVTPNFASGVHERVVRGFGAGCMVVSDENDYTRASLHHLRAYHGLEWHEPDLADRLAEVFATAQLADGDTQAAQTFVDTNYDPAAFVTRMIDLAQIVRLQPAFAGYDLQAA